MSPRSPYSSSSSSEDEDEKNQQTKNPPEKEKQPKRKEKDRQKHQKRYRSKQQSQESKQEQAQIQETVTPQKSIKAEQSHSKQSHIGPSPNSSALVPSQSGSAPSRTDTHPAESSSDSKQEDGMEAQHNHIPSHDFEHVNLEPEADNEEGFFDPLGEASMNQGQGLIVQTEEVMPDSLAESSGESQDSVAYLPSEESSTDSQQENKIRVQINQIASQAFDQVDLQQYQSDPPEAPQASRGAQGELQDGLRDNLNLVEPGPEDDLGEYMGQPEEMQMQDISTESSGESQNPVADRSGVEENQEVYKELIEYLDVTYESYFSVYHKGNDLIHERVVNQDEENREQEENQVQRLYPDEEDDLSSMSDVESEQSPDDEEDDDQGSGIV